jgi:hypothetical protein
LRARYLVLAIALLSEVLLLRVFLPTVFFSGAIAFSIALMGTEVDFGSLAKRLSAAGHQASASGKVTGKSGVKHQFSFMVMGADGSPEVVAETALSVTDVDETKVLAFFVKVFDVKAKHAILCASPRLNPGAQALANQYKIITIEHEKPRELVPMLSRTVDRLLIGN